MKTMIIGTYDNISQTLPCPFGRTDVTNQKQNRVDRHKCETHENRRADGHRRYSEHRCRLPVRETQIDHRYVTDVPIDQQENQVNNDRHRLLNRIGCHIHQHIDTDMGFPLVSRSSAEKDAPDETTGCDLLRPVDAGPEEIAQYDIHHHQYRCDNNKETREYLLEVQEKLFGGPYHVSTPFHRSWLPYTIQAEKNVCNPIVQRLPACTHD